MYRLTAFIFVISLFFVSCDNPLSPTKKENVKESFTMDNYYPKNWNVYKDNVYIGILYANQRTKFVGNFEGTHEIKGETSSGLSWWGPYNYTFTSGQNIKDRLATQSDAKGADDHCDTTNEIIVNF